MASKNTKAKAKQEVASIPVLSLHLHFQWLKNPEKGMKGKGKTTVITRKTEHETVTHIVDQLPNKIQGTVTVDRLIGLSYNKDVMSLFDFPGVDTVYDIQPILVMTSKMDEPISVSWSTLSKKESLIKWMLNNGTKLYLSASERIVDAPFRDRNFTELCGDLFEKDPNKVYGSKNMIKSAKDDIKTIKEVHKYVDERFYVSSPLSSFKQAALSIPGALEHIEALAAQKAVKKLLKA